MQRRAKGGIRTGHGSSGSGSSSLQKEKCLSLLWVGMGTKRQCVWGGEVENRTVRIVSFNYTVPVPSFLSESPSSSPEYCRMTT